MATSKQRIMRLLLLIPILFLACDSDSSPPEISGRWSFSATEGSERLDASLDIASEISSSTGTVEITDLSTSDSQTLLLTAEEGNYNHPSISMLLETADSGSMSIDGTVESSDRIQAEVTFPNGLTKSVAILRD